MPGGAKAKRRAQAAESPAPPIDGLRLPVSKAGIQTEVSAIHKGWAEPREYIAFTWPPDDPGAQQQWMTGVKILISDLRWLLRLPYHKFWSQAVFDLGLAECIEDTLQNLPRPHEMFLLPAAPAVTEAIQTTALLQLKVLLRMSTYRESRENHMSPGMFASLVYDNFLWDIPRLLDLCAVYAYGNAALLQRQVASLFTHQPAYLEDLQLASLAMPELLDRVEERVAGSHLDKSKLNWQQLWDVVLYLTDLATTLDTFLYVYPDTSPHLVEAKLPTKLAGFYDTVVPRLWRRLESSSEAEYPPADVVRRHLQVARVALLSVFRRIVDHRCLEPLRNESTGARERKNSRGEEYVELFTECLGEQHFVTDYNIQYSISEDAALIRGECPDLDPARLEYVLSAVVDSAPAFAAEASPPPLENGVSFRPEPSEGTAATPEVEVAPIVVGVELESMVSSVRDLLPDISHSFVVACLEHFNYSTESVINALLEDSLPPRLAALDRTAEIAPAPPTEQPTQPAVSEVLASRKNVFDGDEYDVMSRNDANVAAYHRGKRLTTARLARELADKSDLRRQDMRARYELFGTLSTAGSVYEASNASNAMYEDEYDDTYDDTATAQAEPEEEAETEQRSRMLSQPLQSSRWRRPDPDEQDAAEDGDAAGRRRDQFVQNPAEVRARQEERRQQQRGRGGGRGGGGRRGPPPNRDVVGNARGQGQSKEVLVNRKRKTEHKGSTARRGADRKARGGMF